MKNNQEENYVFYKGSVSYEPNLFNFIRFKLPEGTLDRLDEEEVVARLISICQDFGGWGGVRIGYLYETAIKNIEHYFSLEFEDLNQQGLDDSVPFSGVYWNGIDFLINGLKSLEKKGLIGIEDHEGVPVVFLTVKLLEIVRKSIE